MSVILLENDFCVVRYTIVNGCIEIALHMKDDLTGKEVVPHYTNGKNFISLPLGDENAHRHG
jgi:hypothetical protein